MQKQMDLKIDDVLQTTDKIHEAITERLIQLQKEKENQIEELKV